MPSLVPYPGGTLRVVVLIQLHGVFSISPGRRKTIPATRRHRYIASARASFDCPRAAKHLLVGQATIHDVVISQRRFNAQGTRNEERLIGKQIMSQEQTHSRRDSSSDPFALIEF
jgi:hypothetical protein